MTKKQIVFRITVEVNETCLPEYINKLLIRLFESGMGDTTFSPKNDATNVIKFKIVKSEAIATTKKPIKTSKSRRNS